MNIDDFTKVMNGQSDGDNLTDIEKIQRGYAIMTEILCRRPNMQIIGDSLTVVSADISSPESASLSDAGQLYDLGWRINGHSLVFRMK